MHLSWLGLRCESRVIHIQPQLDLICRYSIVFVWAEAYLYFNLVASNIYLIRILCQSTAKRCVQTASTRCVFKIYNVTRLAYIILHSLKFEIFSI